MRTSNDSAGEHGSAGVSNLLLFLLLCVAAYPVIKDLTCKTIAVPPPVAVVPPRWEYKTLMIQELRVGDVESLLNQRASEGWEYVGQIEANIGLPLSLFHRRK